MSTSAVVTWIAHHRMLSLACVILLIELLLRGFARQSALYARWTAFSQFVGGVWTAVLLSLMYLLSVGPISLGMRLLGKDPLDRSLERKPSFWHRHEPNPLGPAAAARHQF